MDTLPSLPPGAVLDSSPALPPLPRGAVLDAAPNRSEASVPAPPPGAVLDAPAQPQLPGIGYAGPMRASPADAAGIKQGIARVRSVEPPAPKAGALSNFTSGMKASEENIGKGIAAGVDLVGAHETAAKMRDFYNRKLGEIAQSSDPESLSFKAGSIAPSAALAISTAGAGSTIGGMAGLGRAGQVVAGAASASLVPAGEAESRARDEGATPGQAAGEGAISLAAGTAANLLPVGKMIPGAAGSVGRRVFTGALEGAAGSAGQYAVEGEAGHLIHGGPAPTLAGARDAAIQGGIVGGGMAGAHAALDRIIPQPTPSQAAPAPVKPPDDLVPIKTQKNAVGSSEESMPGWLREEMLRQGKNPARMLNEIDAARPKTAQQLANDPVTKYLEQTNPQEADRAKRGDLSSEEYRRQLAAVGKQDDSFDLQPTAEEPNPAQRFPSRESQPGEPSSIASRRPLADFAPTVHTEQSPENANRFMNDRADGLLPPIWMSNNPDLALGQGENRGVRMEFDTKGLTGVVNTSKPTWQQQYDQGNAEFISGGDPAEAYRSALRKITIDPSQLPDDNFSRRLSTVTLPKLEREGWTKTQNEDGTITYAKGEQKAPADVVAPPIDDTQPIVSREERDALHAPLDDEQPDKTAADSALQPSIGAGPAHINDPAFTTKEEGSPTSVKNRIVDQERAVRGLPAAMEEARRGYGQVWDAAMKEMDSNPRAADDLVDDLKKRPRAVTDRESALLLHRQIGLQNEYHAVTDNIIKAHESGDESALGENNARWSVLSDQLLDHYNVDKSAGAETGRGLAARRMMANEDFSLAAMVTAKRAANEGKPLTDGQKAGVAAQANRIRAAQAKLDDYTARVEKQKEQSLIRQIENLESRIKVGDAAGRARMSTADTEVVSNLKKRRDALNDQLAALRGDAPKLEAMKTRTAGEIDRLKGKINAGDFSKAPPRQEIKLDETAQALKAQLERYKQQFQQGLQRDRLQQRSLPEKVQDTFVKWRRGFVLSGMSTLGKLTSAAAERMAFTPGEEAVGAVVGKLIPGIASRAPREGGVNTRAEAKAITEGFTKGMADAYKTLITGKSDLDVLYGREHRMPQTAIDYLGNLHGALKAPVKRNEFARAFQKRAAAAMQGGLDVTDPLVQTRIATDSYKDANRSIFQQDNIVARKVNMFVAKEINKDTGRATVSSTALHTVGKTLLPIMKVPTNIVSETMQYAVGSVWGAGEAARAYAKGVDSLTPAQADVIMRHLKKGSVGAGLLALGYFGANHIGGYYQPGKRDEKDVKFGGVRIFGTDIPRYLLHAPPLEILQIGATIRRVADSRLRKSDEGTQGVVAGAAAAAMGLIEEVPLAQQAVDAGKLFDPRQSKKAAGDITRSIAVPKLVDDIARKMDTDPATGEPTKRKPQTILQNIEQGVPGLRKKVPVDEPRHAGPRVRAPSFLPRRHG